MLSRTSGQGPIVRKQPEPAAVVSVPAPATSPPPMGSKAAFAATLGAKLAVGGPPPKALTPASDGGGSSGPVSKINLTPLDLEDFQNPNNAGIAPAPRLVRFSCLALAFVVTINQSIIFFLTHMFAAE